MSIKDAYKKNDSYFDTYDAIIYGSWVAVEKIHKADWFTKRIGKWKNKKLAMFCVGASPASYSGVNTLLNRALTDEQKKFVKVFYCEGGFDYAKRTRLLTKLQWQNTFQSPATAQTLDSLNQSRRT